MSHQMGAVNHTQLGSRAFNESPSADAEAEYDHLRDLARAEAAKRGSCFQRSHEAYERGDGEGAKQLSEEGKSHAAKMDAYNKQASDFIFRENNANGRAPEDTIDLHGQFVEEAEDIVEARIRYAQRQGQSYLHVIVGKGNHSANHVQKIKPRVEKVCQELGLQYSTEANDGVLYVNLQGGAAVPPPAGDYQAGGQHYQGGQYQNHNQQQQYHGGQSQHQNQQQQGGKNDAVEQVVAKVLPTILRKLEKACCVVM